MTRQRTMWGIFLTIGFLPMLAYGQSAKVETSVTVSFSECKTFKNLTAAQNEAAWLVNCSGAVTATTASNEVKESQINMKHSISIVVDDAFSSHAIYNEDDQIWRFNVAAQLECQCSMTIDKRLVKHHSQGLATDSISAMFGMERTMTPLADQNQDELQVFHLTYSNWNNDKFNCTLKLTPLSQEANPEISSLRN